MANKAPHKPDPVFGRCPVCKAPSAMAHRPFCSARCRDVDLSRWLRGGYAIPGGHADADEDGEDAAAGRARPHQSGEDEENHE